jgi:hypothetical protein
MPNYQEMYYKLFNEVTRIIEQLQSIQKCTEEIYINSENPKCGAVVQGRGALPRTPPETMSPDLFS